MNGETEAAATAVAQAAVDAEAHEKQRTEAHTQGEQDDALSATVAPATTSNRDAKSAATSEPPESGTETANVASDNADDDGDTSMESATSAITTNSIVAETQEDTGHDADGDVAMSDDHSSPRQAKPTPRADVSFFDELSQLFQEDEDEFTVERKGKAIGAAYFATAYTEMKKRGATAKKISELPATTDDQQRQLFELLKTLIADKKSSAQRVTAAITDLVLACFRSSWTLDQLLKDRLSRAQVPTAPPITAWGAGKAKPTGPEKTVQERLDADMAPFRFDSQVYTAADIQRLRALCMAPHGFAEKSRKDTADEWTIIWGLMNGTILMRVLPQFFKRCCTMKQFQWLHHYMVVAAEGELFAVLPKNSKLYDANQTSKRLADTIRASIVHQNWTDPRVEAMLKQVKVVSFNKELHAIHFHFFTKKEAIQWEHMHIPFRNSKIELKNPDERYREISIAADGTEQISHKPPQDGTRDDRYQAPYKFRLTNITRTTEIDKIAQYLQQITGNGLRIGIPVDSYGQGSEWSLVWEFFGTKASCPPALAKINRILWREHAILVIHQAGTANAPCHQCARIGHQESACTTPESEWLTECTLVITEPEIAKIQTERAIWQKADDAKAIFDRLGEEDAVISAAPTSTTPVEAKPTSTTPVETKPTSRTEVADVQPTKTKPVHLQTPLEQVTSEWKTVRASRPRGKAQPPSKSGGTSQKKKKIKQQAIGTTSKIDSSTKDAKTPPTETKSMADSDSEDSDYEDEKVEPHDNTETQSPADSTSDADKTTSNPSAPATTATQPTVSVQEALDNAIARSNMEKLGLAIHQSAQKHRKRLDLKKLAVTLAAKRPDRGDKASKAWILEALSGQVANTPATGNCQFYGIAEALLQQSLQSMADDTVATELTMLLKFGLQVAYSVDEKSEAPISSIASMAEKSQAAEPEAIRQYFEQLAMSSSTRGAVLPTELWGCTETLRMAAKVLGRRIDIVMDTADASTVYVMQFQPQKIRDRQTKLLFDSAATHQPGTAVWLETIQHDLERGTVPIVLHYSPRAQHYSAVLLHRETKPSPPKRQTYLSELIQKPTSVDDLIDTAKRGQHHGRPDDDAEQGPTRQELLASQSDITPNMAMAALAQTNWTQGEKKILIDCLVRDPGTIKAMLTFWGDSSQTADTPMSLAQSTPGSATQGTGSDASYEPSDSPTDDSDDEDDDDDAPYAFPSPDTAKQFAAWTRAKWQEVRTEWAEQDGAKLPALTDQQALHAYAAKYPEEMAAAGQLFANPFRFLDHFQDDGITAWMSHRWIKHGAKAIGERVEYLTEPAERAAVCDWLDKIHNASTTSVRLRWWKTKKIWRTLRAGMPELFKGPAAVPFLSDTLTQEAAFVLAIDTLLPSLARDLQGRADSAMMTGTTLAEVYVQTPEFQTAMKTAIQDEDWEPVETYLRTLRPTATPAARC